MDEDRLEVQIRKLDPELPTPAYARHGDAGMDVYSREDYLLAPGEHKVINTGLAFHIPYGFEMQVRARSGLAAKHGIGVLNGPGTIDHGYRGELGVILVNHGKQHFEIKRGDRIAQIVFKKVELVSLVTVDDLPPSERGDGGFGSSGRY